MLEEEIRLAIEKNIPAQVGDVLRQRLEQAEKDAVKVKQQEEALQNKNAAITKLEKQLAEYKTCDERNAKLQEREKKIAEEEINLKVTKLEYELIAEKSKSDFAERVALGLVRNVEYKKAIMENVSKPLIDNYGSTTFRSETNNTDVKESAE